MERRTLLQLLGATSTVGLAGCSSDTDSGATPSPSPRTNQTMTQNQTETSDDPSESDGLVTVTAEEGFEQTVNRITTDIENSELTLMTTVDHAENAASVDMDLPPTTLLIFGNPAAGTPLIQASRTVAIDLPQKMLVWDDDGQTKVTYNDPEYLANRHDIDGQSDRLTQINSVLEGLATGEN